MVLQMIELSKQGYTQKQIGEKLQVHPSTVCQKLKKAEADGLFDGRCPRVEQAEQNRQHKQEKRIRYLKQKMRLQDQKKYLEKMQYKPNEELKSNSRSGICCEQEYPQIQMLGSYVNTENLSGSSAISAGRNLNVLLHGLWSITLVLTVNSLHVFRSELQRNTERKYRF